MTDASERIIQVLAAIPRGKVISYRDAALAAGLSSQGARQVARLLHSSSQKYNLPWHRVIRSDGRIALDPGQGAELQRALLLKEGVKITSSGADAPGRVDLGRFGWQP
jgi:methylated-DNA-protein-cysteine methyltransferase-like protein